MKGKQMSFAIAVHSFDPVHQDVDFCILISLGMANVSPSHLLPSKGNPQEN